MRVEILDGLNRPLAVPASRVLVTADDGTPVALVAEHGGSITVSHAGRPGFARALATWGVDRTVLVTEVRDRPGRAVLGDAGS